MYGEVLANKHMQMSHLLQADRCSPALDVAFTIFQSRRKLENEMSARRGASNISAISRVAFDKHATDARRNVQRAAARQLAFWTELNDPVPDVSRLHVLANETNEAIRAAEVDFAEVFHLAPQALAQLRLYAAFTLHVTANADKASVLLAEAERIEDVRSREHRVSGPRARARRARTCVRARPHPPPPPSLKWARTSTCSRRRTSTSGRTRRPSSRCRPTCATWA
jgi:hypothetical protein